MDLSKEDIYYPFDYVVVTPGFLEKNGDTALAFLKGLVEGIHKFKTDKRVAKDVLTKYTKVTDDGVLEETQQIFARLFQKLPYITRQSLRSVVQLLGETDPRVNAIKLDTLVDDRYVRQLETSGFIQNVYR
jgi:ABC-type nitrate/sulfonate/bicarbonate transport system substrate-binding protein